VPALTEDAVLARKVAFLSLEYLVRAFRGLSDAYGDARTGLIVYAISVANTGHLDVRTRDPRIAGPEGILPDDVRTPVSITQVAKSLGMPFETVRKQVHKLIGAGICARVDGGVIVTKKANQRPEVVRAVLANLDHVRQLVRDVKAVGLDVGP
jgi:hypothetical protein